MMLVLFFALLAEMAFINSLAALSPVIRAAWVVDGNIVSVASPAKNSFPSTDLPSSALHFCVQPTRRMEYETLENSSDSHLVTIAFAGSGTSPNMARTDDTASLTTCSSVNSSIAD